MPINLSKGQKVSLTKSNPGLKNIMVGLGWDVNAFDTGADFDLDAAAFMLGSNGKCPTDQEFVFYGNLEHPTGSVKHMGDNRTGEGEGDDPSANDRQMYEWILHNGYEPIIIATKLDKLKRSQVQKNLKAIREGLQLKKGATVIPYSATTKQGRDEIWELIDSLTGLVPQEEA